MRRKENFQWKRAKSKPRNRNEQLAAVQIRVKVPRNPKATPHLQIVPRTALAAPHRRTIAANAKRVQNPSKRSPSQRVVTNRRRNIIEIKDKRRN